MGFFKRKSKTKNKATKSTTTTPQKEAAPATPDASTPATQAAAEDAATPVTPPPVTDSEMANDPVTPQKEPRPTETTPSTEPGTDIKEEGEENDGGRETEEDEDPGLSAAAKQVLDELEANEGETKETLTPEENSAVPETAVTVEEATPEEESAAGTNASETQGPVDVDGPEEASEMETPAAEEQQEEDPPVSRRLFENCDVFHAVLPESWTKTPDVQQEPEEEAKMEEVKEEEKPKMSYYNQDFAMKFLEEFLNVGFALVYHQPSVQFEDEDASDWQGRSVTMVFRPGICNALEVSQPSVEWSTMGGGKDKEVLTRSVELRDIHSIAVSNSDDMRDDLEDQESEDVQCFFTFTTKSGDVHVFEALSRDESNRLSLGIKNTCGRYGNLVVAGNYKVLTEFFDSSAGEPEIQLSRERAMTQVSHSFLV